MHDSFISSEAFSIASTSSTNAGVNYQLIVQAEEMSLFRSDYGDGKGLWDKDQCHLKKSSEQSCVAYSQIMINSKNSWREGWIRCPLSPTVFPYKITVVIKEIFPEKVENSYLFFSVSMPCRYFQRAGRYPINV